MNWTCRYSLQNCYRFLWSLSKWLANRSPDHHQQLSLIWKTGVIFGEKPPSFSRSTLLNVIVRAKKEQNDTPWRYPIMIFAIFDKWKGEISCRSSKNILFTVPLLLSASCWNPTKFLRDSRPVLFLFFIDVFISQLISLSEENSLRLHLSLGRRPPESSVSLTIRRPVHSSPEPTSCRRGRVTSTKRKAV